MSSTRLLFAFPNFFVIVAFVKPSSGFVTFSDHGLEVVFSDLLHKKFLVVVDEHTLFTAVFNMTRDKICLVQEPVRTRKQVFPRLGVYKQPESRGPAENFKEPCRCGCRQLPGADMLSVDIACYC